MESLQWQTGAELYETFFALEVRRQQGLLQDWLWLKTRALQCRCFLYWCLDPKQHQRMARYRPDALVICAYSNAGVTSWHMICSAQAWGLEACMLLLCRTCTRVGAILMTMIARVAAAWRQ